jgi:4-diphosphocytidyl-2-C-methyl-D-erythritol kinase
LDGNPEQNLVLKAYSLLKKEYALPETDIYLRKNIPSGAGLGGGSSDAALMLKLLNNIYELHISEHQLEEFASQLGADCPFFIRNEPVFATGIGNIFTPVNLSLKDYFIVLVKPDIHVSTKEAYESVKPEIPAISLKEIIKNLPETWKDTMVNDFELSVFVKYPAISDIKEKLYNFGAVYASMSGSGSSVFGIFKEEINLSKEFQGNVFCVECEK